MADDEHGSIPNDTEGRLTASGRVTATEMFGPGGPERLEAAYAQREAQVDASWAELTSNFITNGMYSRNVLPTPIRELCAVAALTVLARESELRDHIRIALHTNRPEHVREVILQMSVYGGMPVAFDALRIYEKVLSEQV